MEGFIAKNFLQSYLEQEQLSLKLNQYKTSKNFKKETDENIAFAQQGIEECEMLEEIARIAKTRHFERVEGYMLEFKDFGKIGWFALDYEGVLYTVPQFVNGTFDSENISVLTAPENQDLLNKINNFFGTSFKMTNFSGR